MKSDIRSDLSSDRRRSQTAPAVALLTKERLQESNEALTQKVRERDRKVARLQRELIDTHTHARNMAAHLNAAISLLEWGSKDAAPSDKMFDQMLADYRKSLEWYYDSRMTLTDNEDTKA